MISFVFGECIQAEMQLITVRSKASIVSFLQYLTLISLLRNPPVQKRNQFPFKCNSGVCKYATARQPVRLQSQVGTCAKLSYTQYYFLMITSLKSRPCITLERIASFNNALQLNFKFLINTRQDPETQNIDLTRAILLCIIYSNFLFIFYIQVPHQTARQFVGGKTTRF